MTTATILGRATRIADDIDAQARNIDPRRALLILVAVIPFLIGWTACMVWRAFWTVASWTFAAVLYGWRTAAGDKGG